LLLDKPRRTESRSRLRQNFEATVNSRRAEALAKAASRVTTPDWERISHGQLALKDSSIFHAILEMASREAMH
jgi:hypothetical protein